MQLCSSLSILWHCLSWDWNGNNFSSPVATAEFSKFAGILSAALTQHHLLGSACNMYFLSFLHWIWDLLYSSYKKWFFFWNLGSLQIILWDFRFYLNLLFSYFSLILLCLEEQVLSLLSESCYFASPHGLIWQARVCGLVTQSCPTFCDPVDCSLPGSTVHGIIHARMLEWVVIPLFRVSSLPRGWTWVSWIAGRRFTIWATRKVTVCLLFTYWSTSWFLSEFGIY